MSDRRRPPGRGAAPTRPSGASTARRPAPRPPQRVFWVRRLVVLGLPLVVIVLLVVWLTGRGDAPAGPPQAEPTAAGAPTPEPEPSTDPGGVPECVPAQLALVVAPGGEAFPAGADPTFEVSVTNSGPAPCLVDAGDAHREVVVTSGQDRVWSSRDCVAADAEPRTLLLVGGQSDVTQLVWPRTRSAQGCPGGLPEPGAGTYSVTVALAGATSPAAVFGLG